MSFGEVSICCRVRLSHLSCGGKSFRMLTDMWVPRFRLSTPTGAPTGGISAVRKVILQSTSNIQPKRNDTWVIPYNPTHQTGAIAALYTFHLPPETKNFPHDPAIQKANQNLALKMAGSWGKFSGGQGGLEGRRSSFKRTSCASKVFSCASKVFSCASKVFPSPQSYFQIPRI